MNPVVLGNGSYRSFASPHPNKTTQMKWLCQFPAWRNLCVYSWRNTCTVEHTQSCCWAVADVWAGARRPSRCLLPARLYWEKKHKADCRARMGHLETIILRKSILRPFILSLHSFSLLSLFPHLKWFTEAAYSLSLWKREDEYNWIALFIKLWWLKKKWPFNPAKRALSNYAAPSRSNEH